MPNPLHAPDMVAAVAKLQAEVAELQALRRRSMGSPAPRVRRPFTVKKLRQTSGTLDLVHAVSLVDADDPFDPEEPSMVSVIVTVEGESELVADTTAQGSVTFTFDSLPFHIPDTSVTFDGTTADLSWNADPTVDLMGTDVVAEAGSSRIDGADFKLMDLPGLDGSWYRRPLVSVYLYDGDIGLPPTLTADLDLTVAEWNHDEIGNTSSQSLSWMFGQGTPEVLVLIDDPDNQYGGETYTVDIVSRVVQFV